MAKYDTFKTTAHGKAQTASRKARRATKYASPGLDVARLTVELHREQARMDRANTKGGNR